MWSADQGDDRERFLADLRALRDKASLGYDELAARAHYPSYILKEAENGPSLPGLPILTAYVRACEGDVLQWEERWRRLGYKAWADPSLPVRPAGASPAAVAGARAGIGIAPPDVYDPERIRAALRGHHGRADGTAQKGIAAALPGRTDPDTTGAAAKDSQAPDGSARWGAETGWGDTAYRDASNGQDASAGRDAASTHRDAGAGRDAGGPWKAGPQRGAGTGWETAADQAGASTNGDHQTGHRNDGLFDTSVTGTADQAGSPESTRHDPFSTAWLQDGQPTPRSDSEPVRPDRADDGPQPARQDSWFTPPNPPGSERNWRSADAGPDRHPDAVADLLQGRGGDLAQDGVAHPTQAAGSAVPAQSKRPTESAVPQTTVAAASEPRRDRLYPLRLLVVIVVAALIGSILVLLIR